LLLSIECLFLPKEWLHYFYTMIANVVYMVVAMQ
jgi:hypothetical protein